MEWVETTGATVEEALDRALDQLGVDEDDAEYEVLVQPKAGLFGRFGGTEARIRARVKPISREKPGERRRRGRKERSGGSGSASGGGAKRGGRGGQGRQEPQSVGAAASVGAATTAAAERPQESGAEGASAPTGSGRSRSRRRRRGGANKSKPEGTAVEQEVEVSVEEQAATAVEFVSGLVSAFGLRATVGHTVDDDDAILIEVEGSDLGLLVGPKGVTLQAIEELVRTVLQRSTNGLGARINVDVAGYRAKRRAALEAFTHQLIQRAIESGKDQVLEPMSAADRKVVHDTAAAVEGVTTSSEGDEPRRRVVIHPS